ncbi:hypothetical protein AB1046_09480 [Promicromonospora sp. Populi]|uniref:hypothetical protein n=1 Tax=Promicromonospora sp. Populi TaxID=3239420 RepID=UPI0034E2EEF9
MARRTMWVTGGGILVAGIAFGAGMSLGYALRPDSGAHVLAQTADEWAAFGTVGTLIIAAVAAVIAFTQAAEARRLRIEQAQPYVVAYMKQNSNTPVLVELVIRNFGTTAARNITVTSTPTIRRADGAKAEDVWLPTDIPVLAPQQEWRTFWDSGAERFDHPVLADENRHVVTVTYDGVERSPQQVSESILDWGAYVGGIFITSKTVHHAAQSLGKIATVMGRWTDSSRGLTVYTRDGRAKDARVATELEERARRRQRREPHSGSDPESIYRPNEA